jgi:hypothetical protein
MDANRLKKLARHIDTLAARDRERLAREKEIENLRRVAARELHSLCLDVVDKVNSALQSTTIELAPAQLPEEAFHESTPNLIQINISGRVVQFLFEGTEPLVSTENLKIPYTLEGSVRWYNQDMLDRDEVKDQLLYYCLDRRGNQWRFYDPRSHRSGLIDEDYLAGLLEQLV